MQNQDDISMSELQSEVEEIDYPEDEYYDYPEEDPYADIGAAWAARVREEMIWNRRQLLLQDEAIDEYNREQYEKQQAEAAEQREALELEAEAEVLRQLERDEQIAREIELEQ